MFSSVENVRRSQFYDGAPWIDAGARLIGARHALIEQLVSAFEAICQEQERFVFGHLKASAGFPITVQEIKDERRFRPVEVLLMQMLEESGKRLAILRACFTAS